MLFRSVSQSRYGGKKGVSSEMLIFDSEVIEETNVENILQYSFAGLTVLGDTDAMGQNIAPAVEGCQGVLVTNASMNSQYQKAKEEFEKILYHSTNQGSANAGSFFNTKNQKEEAMGKEQAKNSSPSEVVENAEQVITTETKVSQDTHTYGDHGEYLGSTHESHKFEKTEIVDVPEDTAVTATNATSEEETDPEKVENATDPEVSENACDPQDNACDTAKNAEASEQDQTDEKRITFMSYLNKLHKHIDITVVNGKEYTFTCTVCKYTEQRLQLTAKGGAIVTGKQIGRASCRERVSSPV